MKTPAFVGLSAVYGALYTQTRIQITRERIKQSRMMHG